MRVRKTVEIEIPDFPERLRQALDSSPMAVAEVARQMGLKSTQYLYDLMGRKKDSVTYERVRQLEEVLGVDFGVKFED